MGPRRSTLALLLATVFSMPWACRPAEDPATAGGTETEAAAPWRYDREFTFVGLREESALAVAIAARASPTGDGLDRSLRAWLAHDSTWDAFVDERWPAAAAGGVWRVVPRGSLRFTADAAGSVESLWYSAGERRLRIALEDALSDWHGGERERARLRAATLALGSERLDGVVVEEMEVDRAPARGSAEQGRDRIVLLGADGTTFYIRAEAPLDRSAGTGRLIMAPGEPATAGARVRWLEMRPLEEARRDVPVRWAIEVPAAGLIGEVEAVGQVVVAGEERGGRRAVEVRFTLRGWVERYGDRTTVAGEARHEQG